MVDNLHHSYSYGGGPHARKYWDSAPDFVEPLSALLRQAASITSGDDRRRSAVRGTWPASGSMRSSQRRHGR